MSNPFSKGMDAGPELSVEQVKEKLGELKLIDVRRPDEFVGELGHIRGATLVTIETDLENYLDKLPKDATYAFVCRSGARSFTATQMALDKGFEKVFNMKGGMLAWNASGFEVEKK
ncbi:MAG: rhodanese-like domain-containing protein [Deltaproteobacteria bacterium]|nr:rhodanese-like domain-containing protein [Deltaproteobacteria bacterium]